jgi:hypothetical protein
MLAEKTDSANKIAFFANMGKKTAKNIANKKSVRLEVQCVMRSILASI